VPDKEVTIYTDGACLGNPGPGGYGIVLLYKGHRKELSAGYRLTTNNRMELLGAIRALESLKEPCNVDLHSDSEYVVNGMEKGWARRWRANGWRKSDKTPAVNPDLWSRLLDLTETHRVRFHWVRGHNGNVENERVDRLAVAAAQGPALAVDEGYEASLRSQIEAPPAEGETKSAQARRRFVRSPGTRPGRT
jgi:ribonuclease HI